MLTFNNDPKVKEKYVNRLRAHREAEHLVQGVGWSKDSQKGCLVGCTLESYDHQQYEVELQIPEWVAHLQDRIFEGLPKGEAEQFATDFLEKCPVGVDLDQINYPMLISIVESTLETFDHDRFPLSKKAIDGVLELLREGCTDSSTLRSAAAEAHVAHFANDANAAEAAYTAYAAAYAAEANTDATYVDCAAAYAATAYAAYAAADTAAAYRRFASRLIELCEGAEDELA